MSRQTIPVNIIKSHSCKSAVTSGHAFSMNNKEMAPQIVFEPNGHLLVDDKLEIKIDKLGQNQKVTVYAYLEEEGKKFEACGCFMADNSGAVNLGKQASLSGTYIGVSDMGLFWSMVPCPGQMEGIRLMKKNLDTPFKTQVTVYDGHFSLDDLREKTPAELCATIIERWYKSPGVTSYEVTDGNVRGKLYLPPGDGPFPGVIDLFGTVGGITEYRSALLASRGFASLALPYFLYKDLPESLFDLNLDYFLEAIEWLLSRENVISSGLGVIGTSKGGDIALLMGTYSKKVKAEINMAISVSDMGLFWSMVPCPGQMEGIRLMKKNLDTPFKTQVTVYDGHFSLDDLREKTPAELCATIIERWYKSPGVTSYEVTDGNVRGKLYLPPGDGPFPGVIDLFGTVGGITEYRSALLASRGFASLALPYFLYKDLPESLFDLNLDYFLEAIEWLLSRENVISSGLGVIGTSKGGDIALLMGTYSKKVHAIVNINGCTFNASMPMKYSGGDIPEVPLLFNKIKKIDGKYSTNEAVEFTPSDIIQVWKNDAKILNILGEDDMCSPKECIRMLKDLYPIEKTDNCTVVAYEGAGHLVEPPYTPLCNMSYHKSFDMFFWWGGQPEPHAVAEEDSWWRILKFFNEQLPVTAAKL